MTLLPVHILGGLVPLASGGVALSAAQYPIAQRESVLAGHTARQVMHMMSVDAAAFDVRWANWIARGRVHEQRARRRFVACAAVVTAAAAFAYLLVR